MEEKKLVPKRRFSGFEGEWEFKSYESLAEIVRGSSPRPIEDPKWFDRTSDVGWLRISDVTLQNGRIKHLEHRISMLGQQKTRVIRTPHLLLSIAATVGKPVINYVETGVHDGFLIFIKPQFDIEYMYQWLEMFRAKWQQYGQPGSQVNLNSDIVKKHVLLIPDVTEQQKIGKFFKVLDERIANQERKIAKVKALKEAYLTEMFPPEGETVPKRRFAEFEGEWTQELLGDFGTVEMNKRIFKWQTSESGDVPFYKIGTFGKKPDAFISYETFKEYKRKYPYPSKGDLLISASGSIGRVVEYMGKDEYFQDSNIVWLKHDGKLNNLFLKQFYEIVQWAGLEGSTIQRLYNKDILETAIIVPASLEEQEKIGQFFKNLDDQIQAEEAKLEKLKKMKSAYLEEMFV